MADGFTETPVRGKRTNNAATTADDALSTLPAVATAADPTLTEGNVVALSTDLGGNLRVVLSAVEGGTASMVDVTDRAGREVGIVSLDSATLTALETTELGASTLAALESIDLNAATLAALEKTTPQVRGADVDDTNPLPVNIQTNPGTLIDSGLLTSASLAPAASVTLSSAAVGAGLTGRLVEITAASSVRIKVELRAGGTARRVFFVDPSATSLVYHPVDRDALTAAATEDFDLVITNMDNLRTADVYGSTTHVEF